jgi:hypothetical protein
MNILDPKHCLYLEPIEYLASKCGIPMDLDTDDVITHLPCSVVALPPPQILGPRHQDHMSLKKIATSPRLYVPLCHYVKLNRRIDHYVPSTANIISDDKPILRQSDSHDL